MPKDFIVAIELGSKKITGIAGRKNQDGSISTLAVVSEDSSACIRKGVVYNIDKTVLLLSNIIKKMENTLHYKIARVYVGVGGQSIRSVKNNIVKEFPQETVVSKSLVDEIMDNNRGMGYPDQEILDVAPQEFRVDNQYQLDPVGILCNRIEGNFLNILCRKAFYRNLNTCFDQVGIAIAEMYLSPLALADAVLTENEKRSGCVLVDMGADTTTVAVYHKSLLRHLAVIPLGGNNITKDIASLQLEDSAAEQMKLKYASAYTAGSDIDDGLQLPLDNERKVDSRTFVDIVEARLHEILENVWNQVPAEYTDKLLGGIVLTGGGSNMKNIEKAVRNVTSVEKTRIAKFVNLTIHSTNQKITAHDATMNTVLAILAKGDMNCAGDEISNDLFNQTGNPTGTPAADPTKGPGTKPAGTGRVPTEAEKKAEEEARQKREAEKRAEEERLAAEQAEEERKRKENGFFHRSMRGLKNFFNTVVGPDGEE